MNPGSTIVSKWVITMVTAGCQSPFSGLSHQAYYNHSPDVPRFKHGFGGSHRTGQSMGSMNNSDCNPEKCGVIE